MIFLFAWVPWLLLLGGFFYIGLRLVKALERRSLPRGETQVLEARVRALEETIGELSSTVDRMSEAQEFTTRLLTKRAGGGEPDSPRGPSS